MFETAQNKLQAAAGDLELLQQMGALKTQVQSNGRYCVFSFPSLSLLILLVWFLFFFSVFAGFVSVYL